jgi:hypothetical protein
MKDICAKSSASEHPHEDICTMNMLYDSETFAVVHIHLGDQPIAANGLMPTLPTIPTLARHGFEIVDKRSGKEVYLDGSWAEMFQSHIHRWQSHTPSQDEVEAMLDSYCGLAQMPLHLH